MSPPLCFVAFSIDYITLFLPSHLVLYLLSNIFMNNFGSDRYSVSTGTDIKYFYEQFWCRSVLSLDGYRYQLFLKTISGPSGTQSRLVSELFMVVVLLFLFYFYS